GSGWSRGRSRSCCSGWPWLSCGPVRARRRAEDGERAGARGSAAARDRGDDRDRVAGLEGGLGVVQEPDVLLVHEQPHVAPQLARGIAEPVLEALVLRLQGLDEAGDAAGLDLTSPAPAVSDRSGA